MTTTPPPMPEALRYAAECETGHPLAEDAKHAAALLRTQHDRITALESEIAALRGEIDPSKADRYMTVVYVSPTKEDVQSFMDHPKAHWFGWCHAPYERDAARTALESTHAK